MQFHGKKRLAPIKCPLCGSENDIIVNGLIHHKKEEYFTIDEDLGYAFCNCHNIFYTDWGNMDRNIYFDPDYVKDYADQPHHRKRYCQYAMTYFPIIEKEIRKNATFLEVGYGMDSLLDEAAKRGWKTTAIDMVKKKIKKKHRFIQGNFEQIELKETFDIIWSAHTFEHFKRPILALKKCWHILNDGGWIFISMPDPIFVDWGENPYTWAHWICREHYIMWDMDSFSEVMEENGFRVVESKHNLEKDYTGHTDFHILAKKHG